MMGPVRAVRRFRARPMGCSVEVVVTRWVVDPAGVDETTAQRRVLDVCLGEIRRCKPLFVGLVGQRYGWRPGRAAIDLAVTQSAVSSELIDVADDVSVTELEFVVALGGPEPVEPLIFFRHIEDAGPRYVDPDPTTISRFRERVQSVVPQDRLVHYDASLDDNGELNGKFERLAVEALSPLVERRCGSRTAGFRAGPCWRCSWAAPSSCARPAAASTTSPTASSTATSNAPPGGR